MVVAVVGGGLLVSASEAAAQERDEDDLRVTAASTYTVDLAASLVRTRIELSFLNTVPDRREGDTIYFTFYESYAMGIQSDATNIVATTSSGAPIAVTTEPDPASDGFYQVLRLAFPDDLRSDEQLDLVVTYDLAGFAPRAATPMRVNEAYALVNIVASGDPGRATVQVIAPRAVELTFPFIEQLVEQGIAAPEPVPFGDADVFTFGDITDPHAFSVFATAADERELVETVVPVGGVDVVFQSWPDDPEWLAFMTAQAAGGLVALEEAIGLPFDTSPRLEVRESAAPTFEGYGGWYDLETGRIEVGEDLDPILLAHELSHGWFNDELSEERWITEGLADTYGNQLTPGGDTEPVPVANGEDFALNEWDDDYRVEDNETIEEYGYATSHYVVDALYDEVGANRMRGVVQAMDAGELAYPGEDGPDRRPGAVSWNRFLDLVEDVGGAEDAAQLFREHVVPPDQIQQLDDREAARRVYDALAERGDGWVAPEGVRGAMGSWDFAEAVEAIATAEETLDARDALTIQAAASGVTAPSFEEDYEMASTLGELESVTLDIADVGERIDLVVATDDLVVDERTLFAQLALRDEDFADELDDARLAITANQLGEVDAIAADIAARLGGADAQGRAIAAEVADGGVLPATGSEPAAGLAAGALSAMAATALIARRRDRGTVRVGPPLAAVPSGGVGPQLDPSGDPSVDGHVEVGVGAAVDLQEDALPRASLGRMDGVLDVPHRDDGQRAGAPGIVEHRASLADVGDPVLQLDEDVRAVVDAEAVPGAQVLVDPDAHDDVNGT